MFLVSNIVSSNQNIEKMEQNLSMVEAYLRYALMMIPVIAGGLMGSLWVMLLGLPIFVTAITAWCPVYYALGINHADKG